MNYILIMVFVAYSGTAALQTEHLSLESCKTAGDAAKAMAGGTVKNITYVCMKK